MTLKWPPTNYEKYRPMLLFCTILGLMLLMWYAGLHLGYEAGYNYVQDSYIEYMDEFCNCICYKNITDTHMPGYKGGYLGVGMDEEITKMIKNSSLFNITIEINEQLS